MINESPPVLVLVDGMSARATEHMPRLLAEVAAGRMSRQALAAARPTWSRPHYATLITGRTPAQQGIVSNSNGRRVRDTLIDDVHAVDGRELLAGYHWWRDVVGPDLDQAWYYDADDTPDDEVFGVARALMEQHQPLLPVIHPMSVDFAGHQFGGLSSEYFAAARRMDERISAFTAVFRRLAPAGRLLITTDVA